VSEILVTFASLQQAGDDVGNSAVRIQAQLRDLRDGLGRVAAGWEGEAFEQYRARQRRWDAAAQDLGDVLTRISVALRQAAETYRATESRNAALWS
jgi:WXG100 family type VII secretion target